MRIEPAILVVLFAAVLPAQVDWQMMRLRESFEFAPLAYDQARERVVLFRGHDPRTPGDTWEWDGLHWIRRTVPGSPIDNQSYPDPIVYDAARQRTILFGNATWEWNGVLWTKRAPVVSPAPRLWSAMAYDAAQQRVILFGGGVSWLGGYRNDTWEWDGVNWTQCTPATSPSARAGHAMAYDAARQRVVLFGGMADYLYGSYGPRDTWEWDGKNWLQCTPATIPSGRVGHAMAYDAARQRVVLFGGDWLPTSFGDTWEWDGVNWVQRFSSANPPPGAAGLAYDSVRQRIVLLGGRNGLDNSPGETWEWDGTNWLQRGTAAAPRARSGHGLSYDAARQRTVLFGGSSSGYLSNETWEWDGFAWTLRSAAIRPVPRRLLALAYESGSQQTLLFGGRTDQLHPFGDIWEWDGIGWTQRSPAASPSARSLHAMAYDAARQRVVLFGGETAPFTGSGDTWEWDGVNWVQQNPSVSPAARSSHALAYDTARQQIVLFGGATGAFTFVNDTWEWDGSAWVQSNPVTRPPARSAHAMAYDAGRQRTVLFGGSDNSQNPLVTYADIWEWDGVNWVQQVSSTSPGARSAHAMAYDVARQRTLLFGGLHPASAEPFGDTWVRGNPLPATAAVIGSPCAGTSGPPVITSNLPLLGNEALVVDLLSARASAPCLFVLASGTQNTSLGGGCSLYVNDLLLPRVAATNPSGFASTQFSVPPDLSLRGVAVYAQALVLDPMGSFAGLAMSAGLGLVLGD